MEVELVLYLSAVYVTTGSVHTLGRSTTFLYKIFSFVWDKQSHLACDFHLIFIYVFHKLTSYPFTLAISALNMCIYMV